MTSINNSIWHLVSQELQRLEKKKTWYEESKVPRTEQTCITLHSKPMTGWGTDTQPSWMLLVALVLHNQQLRNWPKKPIKSNYFFLIFLMRAISEQTQCSAGPCRLSASLCKGRVFSLQNLFLQSTDCGCQHLHLWHIKYEFSAHKDFIMHHRLWFSTPSALAFLSGSWSSD